MYDWWIRLAWFGVDQVGESGGAKPERARCGSTADHGQQPIRLFMWGFLIWGYMATVSLSAAAIVGDADSEMRETARLLAVLLDSGRLAIGRNQERINNPSTADAAFTPDSFISQTISIFRERTGHNMDDLPHADVPTMAKPLLQRLLEESKRTVESYQPVLNMKGLKYKGLIPATFGTETAARFQKWSGVYMKQTAPPHLLRNSKNKPDAFEEERMKEMSKPAFRDKDTVVSDTDGAQSVRVLLPLFYEKTCLSCHGEPKGERDISGYPREGGKEGQLGGAISVKIERDRLATH